MIMIEDNPISGAADGFVFVIAEPIVFGSSKPVRPPAPLLPSLVVVVVVVVVVVR